MLEPSGASNRKRAMMAAMGTMYNSALTVAGMVAVAVLLWFAMWLVWPVGGLRSSERVWRLGRIALRWWACRDRWNRP